MTDALKSCPFCDGPGHFQTAFPSTPICAWGGAAAIDAAAWNRRALVPGPDEVRKAYFGHLDMMAKALAMGRKDVYVRQAGKVRTLKGVVKAYSGPDALKELEAGSGGD